MFYPFHKIPIIPSGSLSVKDLEHSIFPRLVCDVCPIYASQSPWSVGMWGNSEGETFTGRRDIYSGNCEECSVSGLCLCVCAHVHMCTHVVVLKESGQKCGWTGRWVLVFAQ